MSHDHDLRTYYAGIEIYLDAAAHIAYNATATAAFPKYPAGQHVQRKVSPGSYISIYDGSS